MISSTVLRRRAVVAAVAAALLSCVATFAGCGKPTHPAASEPSTSATPSSVAPSPPPDAALPPPEALTDVLYRLADTSIPADQKVPLVEGATNDDATKFDKFGKALQDSGYTPVGFTAENIAWASSSAGNVTADVTVHSQNPAMSNGFTFPMEFTPAPGGGWQLSRTTADILLTFNQNPATPTPPSPTPTG
ncbi:MAG: hypothetical protein JO191_14640 [Mycobacteriaceae bacterium]|nr:hypothetical protein [Mycobacteriaceae bacterium]MBV9513069.1 hypothetical protein [Mycobacteriaceae bacterium]